ncbi:hypothetical protein ABMA27_012168 [Loxostege sticticalis]|uniref:Retrovirus-related Pol polyprotein from type-1 retrotransposable element R1 n=1 Tax=Loxostege sticticalis TaxID=481309 RepID=A0ABR3H0D3_LOXSC
MFGIHTPVKRQMVSRSPQRDEQRAGPSSANQDCSMVRRLTGEWEAGKVDGNPKSPKSPRKVVPAPRPVRAKALPQDPKPAATRRLSSEALSVSPRVEPKYASRVTEAKAMLTKAKLHLKNSKNMKTDIKVEVTQSLERLYQLVKEAEQERKLETKEGSHNEINRSTEPRKESTEDREMERERVRVGKELVERMAEHSKQIEENRKEMEKLKEVIEKDQKDRAVMTYAGVAAAAPKTQSPGHAALHSVVVTSTNEMETGEEVINRVRSAVKAKEEGFQIDRVRKGKDRKIILGCRTRAEIDKVREKLEKEGKHLRVEDIQNKDPLVVLRDLLSYNGDEEVLKGLRAQNKELFEGVSGEDNRIEVKCNTVAEDDAENTRAGAPAKHYAVAQTNLQRKQLATTELMVEASRRKLAFALVQEPYVGGIRRMKDYRGARVYQNAKVGDGTVKAAIVVFDDDLDVIQCPKLTCDHIVAVRIRTSDWEIAAVSFYFEPDKPIGPYLDRLREVVEVLGTRKLLIGGDSNAKSAWWGSPEEDHRGTDMSGTLEESGLHVLNRGTVPTFDTIRGGRRYTSHVDQTACTEDLLSHIENWRVDKGMIISDHSAITFNMSLKRGKGLRVMRTTRKYNTKKADWELFRNTLVEDRTIGNFNLEGINRIENAQQIDQTVENFTEAITNACRLSIPSKKNSEVLKIPWWTEELTKLKRTTVTYRRKIRNAAPHNRDKAVDEYLKKKEEYERQAKVEQISSWKEFCSKQDREGLWEGIYRVISRTANREEDLPLTKNGRALNNVESATHLAETFYPEDTEDQEREHHRRTRALADKVNERQQEEQLDPPFTLTELKIAIGSFNPKKAPGVDGFTADICSRAIFQDPDAFLALLNKCLTIGHFPSLWKQATVVVLRKPGKDDYTNPKAYRPIGLLPVLGKVLEKMTVARMKWHLIPRFSTRQYGFMPQKSTEDALYTLVHRIQGKIELKKLVTLVSLDIEGAFDSAWWPAIRIRLAEEKCPVNIRRLLDSYLEHRSVKLRYAGEEVGRSTNKGCVQGSIGGPILWNLLLDPLLQELERRGCYVQAFADDVILLFDGDTALDVETEANAALLFVDQWGQENKLKFAPHKTCAMTLTRKLKYDTPRIKMGGIDIAMSEKIKILGLTVDHKLTFNIHIANQTRKALDIYKQIARAAKVTWGLHPEIIRLIYNATIEPIIMYAAAAWAPAAEKIGVRKLLDSVQRGFAQKLCKSYRTVSLHSALTLAGILPLDLRIQEAAALYETKRGSPLPELGDRETESRVGFAETPHPALHMDIRFERLEDQSLVDRHNVQEVRIFTDGSKIEGKVGAALSVWKGESEIRNQKFSLSAYCTVYQAELLAICKATGGILKGREKSYGLYSDSMAALETVVNHSSLHPLAVESRENLRKALIQGKDVSLFWIKAHAGLLGNERADDLAKEAALASRKKPDYDRCPVSFAKRTIRYRSIMEWSDRYKNGETAATTKLFFPDAVDAYRLVKKLKPTGLLTQILTGHGGFSQYLHRFKCGESPSCDCDPAVEQTVPHLLIDCPVYDKLRFDFQQSTNESIKIDKLNDLIGNKSTREKFVSYCEQICKQVISKNKT